MHITLFRVLLCENGLVWCPCKFRRLPRFMRRMNQTRHRHHSLKDNHTYFSFISWIKHNKITSFIIPMGNWKSRCTFVNLESDLFFHCVDVQNTVWRMMSWERHVWKGKVRGRREIMCTDSAAPGQFWRAPFVRKSSEQDLSWQMKTAHRHLSPHKSSPMKIWCFKCLLLLRHGTDGATSIWLGDDIVRSAVGAPDKLRKNTKCKDTPQLCKHNHWETKPNPSKHSPLKTHFSWGLVSGCEVSSVTLCHPLTRHQVTNTCRCWTW